MINIENIDVYGWEAAIRGMRNPMNSWDKSDSWYGCRRGDYGRIDAEFCREKCRCDCEFCIGLNDMKLMKSLVKAGTDHRKFLRMINVTMDITAPLYWWKEFDTYKIGTVRNSCSTMHKIHAKEFELDDFSHEHLTNMLKETLPYSENILYCGNGIGALEEIIDVLNGFRTNYIETKNKRYWWQMIQLLPSSYNQRATVQLNYEALLNMYHSRKAHKLDEWREFCKLIENLPYMNEFIGGNENDN